MGTRFSTRPDRPWGPPSLLYSGYRIYLGGRCGRGVRLTPHPHLVLKVLEKIRAVSLLNLRACVAYKKGENLPILLFRLLLSLFIDALIIYVPFVYLERLTRSESIRELVAEEDIWM